MKRLLLIVLPLLLIVGCEKEGYRDQRERLWAEWYDYIDYPNKQSKDKIKSMLNQKLVELVNKKDSEGNYLYEMPSMFWIEDNVGTSGRLTYSRDGSGKATMTATSDAYSEDGYWYITWSDRGCEDNSKVKIVFYIDHGPQFSKKIGLTNSHTSSFENTFKDTSLIKEIYSYGNSMCESFMERNNLMIGVFDTFEECKDDGSYVDKFVRIAKVKFGEHYYFGGFQPDFSEKHNGWKYPLWNTMIDSVKYTIKDCEKVDYTVFHSATNNDLAPTPDELWVYEFHMENPGDKRKYDLSNIQESTRHNGQDCKGHTFKYVDGKKDGIWGDDEVYKNGSKVDFGVDTYYNIFKNYDYYNNGNVKSITTIKGVNINGPNYFFYENGQMKIAGTHKDGKEDGLWTYWYENGQKEIEGTFKDGKFVNKIGQWNEDGSVKE